MKAEWLDRSLVVSPYYYTLCTTEKLFEKELKRLSLPKESWPKFTANDHSDAATHFFESDSKRCVIICVRAKKGVHNTAQVHAMLVHEAVHLWQEIKGNLGEASPSPEFEAYSIQCLSQRLFEEYKRQVK